MEEKQLQALQYKNTIINFIRLGDIPAAEKETFVKGLDNLDGKQLFDLLAIVQKNPATLKLLARQAYKKKMVLNKKDKQAWLNLLQEEEVGLGKKFLEIMDDEIKKSDKQSLDEIRKTL